MSQESFMSQDNNTEAMLSGAIALAKAGERQPALSLIRQVLASEPDNVTALLWAAYLHDDIASIEATLDRVLKLDPHNAKALEWQTLIRQRQVSDIPPPKPAKPKTSRPAPGPLVNYTPPNANGRSQNQLASVNDPSPTLNYANWQQNIATPNPQAALARQTATPIAADYQIREIGQPTPSQPVQIVIQMPATPKDSQNAPGWLVAVLIGLVLLVTIGIVFVVINQSGGLNSVGKPDKSLYQGFNSVEDLMNANLETHQRVDLVIPFEGGYSVDADGYVKISPQTKTGKLVIKWNTKETPLTGFHSNQYVRVYGTVEGINNTITLNVEQAALERG